MMKKLKTIILSFVMCVMILCIADLNVYAAEGKISFSDPQTTVGEEVSVNVKTEISDSVKIGEVWLKLTYDSSALEFVSADCGKLEGGAIVITQPIDNPSSDVCTYTLKFKALKSGSTTIDVSSYNIADSKGKSVNVSKIGKSAVTVAAGTSDNVQSEVDAMISEAEEELSEENSTSNEQTEETSQETESEYNLISGDYQYTAIEFPEDVTVSEDYISTELEINNTAVMAYQNSKDTDYYLIYLINQNGDEGMYLYCAKDNSFVQYSESVIGGEDTEKAEQLTLVSNNYNDLLGKYNENMKIAKDMLYIGIVIIVVLLIIIINLLFRGNHSKDDFEEDEDIEENDYEEDMDEKVEDEIEDDEIDEEDIPNKKNKKERKLKKSKKKNQDDFDDEDDEKKDDFELEFFDFEDED